MKRRKRHWLARRLVRTAFLRHQRTPFTKEWLALPSLCRTGVSFSAEQKARILALKEPHYEDLVHLLTTE